MHSIIWFLIIAPPLVSLVLWQRILPVGRISVRNSPRTGRTWKHGFWIILTVNYLAMFTAAVVGHKL
jgi:hypothetical protein